MISILSKAATWSPEQPFGEAFSRVFSSRLCSAQLIWTAVIRYTDAPVANVSTTPQLRSPDRPVTKRSSRDFYVLRNGFDITSTNVVTGTDVTFYNLAEGGQGFRIGGQADVTFTVPTSGDYKGILLWSEAPDLLNDLGRGGSNFRYRGSIYLPNQRLSWEGSSFGVNPWVMVVARMIDWAGNREFS